MSLRQQWIFANPRDASQLFSIYWGNWTLYQFLAFFWKNGWLAFFLDELGKFQVVNVYRVYIFLFTPIFKQCESPCVSTLRCAGPKLKHLSTFIYIVRFLSIRRGIKTLSTASNNWINFRIDIFDLWIDVFDMWIDVYDMRIDVFDLWSDFLKL